MLEGLSNITTQTYYPLCGHKKLNKLDDSKKLWKQDRGQGNKLENGNNLKMMFKVY